MVFLRVYEQHEYNEPHLYDEYNSHIGGGGESQIHYKAWREQAVSLGLQQHSQKIFIVLWLIPYCVRVAVLYSMRTAYDRQAWCIHCFLLKISPALSKRERKKPVCGQPNSCFCSWLRSCSMC